MDNARALNGGFTSICRSHNKTRTPKLLDFFSALGDLVMTGFLINLRLEKLGFGVRCLLTFLQVYLIKMSYKGTKKSLKTGMHIHRCLTY